MKMDLTNPRYLLCEIHRILVGRGEWEGKNVKKLERWVKTTNINKNSGVIFLRLRDEIIKGLTKLFPVETNDGVKFNSITGVHPFVGQLYGQVVFLVFHHQFLPFLTQWISELHENKGQAKQELARNKYLYLISQMTDFETKYHKSVLMPETAFNHHLGRNWYLPTLDQDQESFLGLITPIRRLLQRVVDLKGYKSRRKLAMDAVSDYNNEDWKESAEFALDKSLDRLKKGEILTLPQLQKLRKVPFSQFIVDKHWASRSNTEKDEILNELRRVNHFTPITDEEEVRFNNSWKKMLDDQNKYFKDVVDGIYELGLIMTFLITRVIGELEKYYPNIGEQFAELNSKRV